MPGLGRCWNAQLLAPPLEHEVGIDAVLQCDRCDRGTGLFRESDQLAFERHTVSAFVAFGAGLWRVHGVHLPELSAHHQGLQLARYCTTNQPRAIRVSVGRLPLRMQDRYTNRFWLIARVMRLPYTGLV